MRSPAWYANDGRCPYCDRGVDEFFARGRCFECYLALVEANGQGLRDRDVERRYIDFGGEA